MRWTDRACIPPRGPETPCTPGSKATLYKHKYSLGVPVCLQQHCSITDINKGEKMLSGISKHTIVCLCILQISIYYLKTIMFYENVQVCKIKTMHQPHLPDGPLLSLAKSTIRGRFRQHLENLGGDHWRRVPDKVKIEESERQTQHQQASRNHQGGGGGGFHASKPFYNALLVGGGPNERQRRGSAH